MNSAPTELELAQARVAACTANFVAQRQALMLQTRQKSTSAYVIGVLVAAVSVVGYFVYRRSYSSHVRPGDPDIGASLIKALKSAQPIPPLICAVGVLKSVCSKNQPKMDLVTPQSQSNAEKPAPMPITNLPRGNWISHQLEMIQAAATAWLDDFAPSMGAALSYYTLFSLAPLLIIVIAVAGMVFGEQAAQGEIVAQLRGLVGAEGALAVEGILKAAREPAKGVVATIVGFAILLLGATAVFAELQSALDRIWRVPAPQTQSGVWNLLRTRLLSFGLVLGLAFMLTVSLVVSAALSALGKWWSGWFAGWDIVLEILNLAVSFDTFTLLFAMTYKIMPRALIPWRDVWTGAAVTAVLFTIGKVLIGLYLARSSLASGFGGAGSLVVLTAWVYYSAQIFLFGAEYTWVYANRHGSRAQTSAI